MRLGWSKQMLRFRGEITVPSYGVTVAKEFVVQKMLKVEIWGFGVDMVYLFI